MKDITAEQRANYKTEVVGLIINELSKAKNLTDLGDIGNLIGLCVGKVTCIEGVDQQIWSFQEDDFTGGFEHGYSLMNGTH